MDSAWVLRSPHADGVHLVGYNAPHETVARLVTLDRGGPQVVDATMLPAGICAVSWCSSDATAPSRLAARSAENLYVIDLDYRAHPRRVRMKKQPDGAGSLCANVAWTDSGTRLVYGLGAQIHGLDVETSTRVWSSKPYGASVSSFATVSEHTVVAGWTGNGGSGSIHLLDLRAPPVQSQSQRTALTPNTVAVNGLCCAPLEPHLLASHSTVLPTADSNGHSEVFVWDLRLRAVEALPVRRLHGRDSDLSMDGIQSPVGLEWSPTKCGTLLALAGAGTGAHSQGGSVYTCSLWGCNPREDADVADSIVATELEAPTASTSALYSSWVGEASGMRFSKREAAANRRQDAASDASSSDIIAACWAHPSRPGAALGLRNGGLDLVVLEQRNVRLCAWNPRGGGIIARQWPASATKPSTDSGVTTAGVQATLEANATLFNSDIAGSMRQRAERNEYGVAKLGYDEYSRVIRTARCQTVTNDALADMWQWVKVADSAANQGPDGDADDATHSWNGVMAPLNAEEEPPDEKVIFPGISVYTSGARRDALQALGYLEPDPPSALTEPPPNPDDVVRRILRAVLWLKFELAASECEYLEPHCGAKSRGALPQLVLVFHAAAVCLSSAGTAATMGPTGTAAFAQGRDSDEDGYGRMPSVVEARRTPSAAMERHAGYGEPSGALSSPVQAFRATLRAVLDLNWNDVPSGPTLRLALRLMELIFPGSPQPMSGRLPEARPSSEDLGADSTPDAFEDSVRTYLKWSNSLAAECAGPQGEPLSPTKSPAGPQTPEASPSVGRPGLAFRCAVAVRFLSQSSLETALEAMCKECVVDGLLDGLSLFGLGGVEGTAPVTVSSLEELASAQAPLPPVLPASRNSLVRSNTVPSLASPHHGQSANFEDRTTADEGSDLVLSYVTRTGDLQSAGLLFCHAAHMQRPPAALGRFFMQYASLLSRWQLHKQRAGLHSLLTARLPLDESSRSRGSILFCFFCGGPLTGPIPSPPGASGSDVDSVMRRCPNANCAKQTPSCAVCLLPVFVIRSRADDTGTGKQPVRLAVDNWVAWCQGCHHGGHINHLEEWFEKHNECPVAGCDCQCALY